MKNLVNTMIPGLDEVLGGGLPEGSITLLSGPPGIGKTAIAMQYINNGIVNGEPGIFLSIENSVEEVREYAGNFGWDYRKHEQEKRLKILDRTIFEESDMELGLDFGILKDLIESIKVKRFVLDSTTLFNYLFKDEVSRRMHMLRFIDLLKVYKCTALMTSEQESFSDGFNFQDWHFLSDGLISVSWDRSDSGNTRRMWVMKMKGAKTDASSREFEIDGNGARVLFKQVI